MQASGHMAALEAERLEEQLLEIQSEFQAFLREQSSQQERIAQIGLSISLLPEERDHEIDQLAARLSDINQQILRLQGQRAHVIRATKAGTVSNLQITEGQTTVANKPLLSIVPELANIEAKVLIPVRAAGFVAEGQHIDIRYDAFPYQKFGLYQGEIIRLSEYNNIAWRTGRCPCYF